MEKTNRSEEASLNILFFGNTNNYPFLLCQEFRELGHNAKIIINESDALHRPESLIGPLDADVHDWIIDCSSFSIEEYILESPRIANIFHSYSCNCDVAILNNFGPSYYKYLNCPHISFLTGSDLTSLASFKSVSKRFISTDPSYRRSLACRFYEESLYKSVIRQREGILMSMAVSYASRGLDPEGDSLLDLIGVVDSDRLFLNLYPLQPYKYKFNKESRQLKIIAGSRIVFSDNTNQESAIDIKGSDILIRGFAQFIQQGGKGVLSLPLKGPDINRARALSETLNISNCINWYDTVPLSNLSEFFAEFDIVCDQFSTSFPGMTTMLALSMGIPVMGDFRKKLHSLNYPGLDVSTPHQISSALLSIYSDKDILLQLSQDSYEFSQSYLSPRFAIKTLLDIINTSKS